MDAIFPILRVYHSHPKSTGAAFLFPRTVRRLAPPAASAASEGGRLRREAKNLPPSIGVFRGTASTNAKRLPAAKRRPQAKNAAAATERCPA